MKRWVLGLVSITLVLVAGSRTTANAGILGSILHDGFGFIKRVFTGYQPTPTNPTAPPPNRDVFEPTRAAQQEADKFSQRHLTLDPKKPEDCYHMLRTEPNKAGKEWEKKLCAVTTYFKKIGVSGWDDTPFSMKARGTLVRDADHGWDRFWTLDVKLEYVEFGYPGVFIETGEPVQAGRFKKSIPAGENRYVRIEIFPGCDAHKYCGANSLKAGEKIEFSGPLVVDRDGPFFEVHPEKDIRKL